MIQNNLDSEESISLLRQLVADNDKINDGPITVEHHDGSRTPGSISRPHIRFFFPNLLIARYFAYYVFSPILNLGYSPELLGLRGRWFFGVNYSAISEALENGLVEKVKAVFDLTPWDSIEEHLSSDEEEQTAEAAPRSSGDKEKQGNQDAFSDLSDDLFSLIFDFLEDVKVLTVLSLLSRQFDQNVLTYFAEGFPVYQTRLDPGQYFSFSKVGESYRLEFDEKRVLAGNPRPGSASGYYDDVDRFYLSKKAALYARNHSSWHKTRSGFGYIGFLMPLELLKSFKRVPSRHPYPGFKLDSADDVRMGCLLPERFDVPINNYYPGSNEIKISNRRLFSEAEDRKSAVMSASMVNLVNPARRNSPSSVIAQQDPVLPAEPRGRALVGAGENAGVTNSLGETVVAETQNTMLPPSPEGQDGQSNLPANSEAAFFSCQKLMSSPYVLGPVCAASTLITGLSVAALILALLDKSVLQSLPNFLYQVGQWSPEAYALIAFFSGGCAAFSGVALYQQS